MFLGVEGELQKETSSLLLTSSALLDQPSMSLFHVL